jgi:hypothetical protein
MAWTALGLHLNVCARARAEIRWIRYNNIFSNGSSWLSSAVLEGRAAPPPVTTTTQISEFYVQPGSKIRRTPLGATFVVNSEPHTGARPLARLCVGIINAYTKPQLAEK